VQRFSSGVPKMDFSWLLAAGPSANTSIFEPVSPPAEAIRSLFILVLAIVGGIFLIVEGVLIYSLLRFRARSNDPSEPPQVYGSRPIEIA
jgi:cytochrome c oxidase subunit 2